jgi:hypothetical protein
MRKFTQRVLLSGAAEMAIIGAVGGVNLVLVGEAQADPTTCVSATGRCQPVQVTGPHLRVAVVCEPIGAKGGVGCRQVAPHPA